MDILVGVYIPATMISMIIVKMFIF